MTGLLEIEGNIALLLNHMPGTHVIVCLSIATGWYVILPGNS